MAYNCCSYHFLFTIIVGWFLLSGRINPTDENSKTNQTYSIRGKSNFFQTDYRQGNYYNAQSFETDTFIIEKSLNYHKQ